MVAKQTQVQTVTIDWGEADQSADQRRQWLASWVVAADGMEGDFFFDGPGGQQTSHDVPADAVGLQLRWWPPATDDGTALTQRGRANASRPYLFGETAGDQRSLSALELAP